MNHQMVPFSTTLNDACFNGTHTVIIDVEYSKRYKTNSYNGILIGT